MNAKDGERCFGWGAQGEFGVAATDASDSAVEVVAEWLAAQHAKNQLIGRGGSIFCQRCSEVLVGLC